MTVRVVIAGGPKTGKTTLARRLHESTPALDVRFLATLERWSIPVRHTDDLIHMGWSEASAAAALWLDEPGPWIIEGVAAPRALRKWLGSHPEGKPCDVVYWLDAQRVELTPGQAAMAKGCATVWLGIVDDLRARGVEIRDSPITG